MWEQLLWARNIFWCVMEQTSGIHFWAEGSKHCCVYWICSAYWICSVSESFSEKAMAPHSSTFAWKIPWTEEPGRLQSMGSLELDTTERLHFHFSLSCIGEGNGNPLQYSCWRIPGMGKPGGLPSLGSHRVGHDWSDLAVAAAESFCLENYWKTDLTRQTESGQFLRSLSMISYLFLKRKFGFSGTGGKIKERIFKWVSEINDKWKMIK